MIWHIVVKVLACEWKITDAFRFTHKQSQLRAHMHKSLQLYLPQYKKCVDSISRIQNNLRQSSIWMNDIFLIIC